MATINDIQNEIIEEFSMFGDCMEKYQYVIELGKNLPVMDESLKKDEFLIPGCLLENAVCRLSFQEQAKPAIDSRV